MKTRSILFVAFTVFLFTGLSIAGVKKVDNKLTPKQRTEIIVKKMTEKLELSADQAGKVKEIILLREKQRDADFEKFQKDEEALKKARKERNKVANERLKTILTAAQFEELRKWRKQMAAHKKEKENKEDNDQLIRELESD